MDDKDISVPAETPNAEAAAAATTTTDAATDTTTSATDAAAPTQSKFSDQEIRDFAEMCTRFAKVPVLRLVIKMLEDADKKSLAKAVSAIVADSKPLAQSIPVPAQFARISPGVTLKHLEVWLGHGPKDYVAEIHAPESMAEGIQNCYMLLKASAITYWQNFILQNKALHGQITAALGECMSEVKVDKTHHTSLYFDPDYTHRIVVMPAYKDARGQYYKKK